MKRIIPVAAVAALLAFGAGTARAATVLKIAAGPGVAMKYSAATLKAKAGVVTIVMTNKGILPHDIAIKGKGVNAKGKLVGKGGVSKVTAKLKPGRYLFYCTVPGHMQAGMKGTLIVG
jgi:plastocyanin